MLESDKSALDDPFVQRQIAELKKLLESAIDKPFRPNFGAFLSDQLFDRDPIKVALDSYLKTLKDSGQLISAKALANLFTHCTNTSSHNGQKHTLYLHHGVQNKVLHHNMSWRRAKRKIARFVRTWVQQTHWILEWTPVTPITHIALNLVVTKDGLNARTNNE